MSGHSKWATTKRQKAAVDAKRSSLFTKLSKNIAIAARDGADPTMNFKLRMAIDAAKGYSMPKDNIERAIARGSGKSGEGQLETALYEGFAPGGIAVLVEAITDNKNRTVSEVKNVFSKHGGNLGGAGAVAWMFVPRGIIRLKNTEVTEEQQLELIDAGLVDVAPDPDGATIICEFERLQACEEKSRAVGLTVEEAAGGYVAKEKIVPQNTEALTALLEALDDLDDVTNIHTNGDI